LSIPLVFSTGGRLYPGPAERWTAELAQLTVLHVDQDYELIAGITGQPVERLRLS
jgi:hypothetical protein